MTMVDASHAVGGTSVGGALVADAALRDVADVIDRVVHPIGDARADVATSGSRLKARYLVGDDGSRQWNYGWFDTQLGVNCSFVLAVDSTTRCLPSSGAGVGTYYGDSGCTQRLAAAAPTACAAPKYATSIDTTAPACNFQYKTTVYSLDQAFAGATVYIKSGVSCLSTPTPATLSFYVLGAEAPAASFVAATEQNG
jgi:hypothetical protein